MSKNAPNHFLKLTTCIFLEIIDPIIAPIIPKKVITKEFLKFIFLFFKLNIILTIAEGTKHTRFVACAIC